MMPPDGQTAAFVDESPFNARPLQGTGTAVLKSTLPLAVVALAMSNAKTSEFRMAAVAVTNSVSAECGSQYLPYTLANLDASADLEMTNATETVLTGRHRWFDQSGRLRQELMYSIPPNRVFEYLSPISGDTGWVEVAPDVLRHRLWSDGDSVRDRLRAAVQRVGSAA